MAKRLTPIEQQTAIADWVDCRNYSEVARKWGVSDYTIRQLVKKQSDTTEMLEQKKIEQVADILSHMDAKKDAVCSLIDLYLERMTDSEKIDKAGIQQLATSMAIVIDKFTATAQNDTALKKLDDLISKIDDEAGRK